MSDVAGEREQNRAQQLLSSHWSAGRLSTEEYDERMDRAQRAQTKAELGALFADLPGEKPFADPLEQATARPTAGASAAEFPVYTPPTVVGETPTQNLPAVIQPSSLTREQLREQRRAARAAYRGRRHVAGADRLVSDSTISSIMGVIWMVTIGLMIFGHAGNWFWLAIIASMFLPNILRGLKKQERPTLSPPPPPSQLPSAHTGPDAAPTQAQQTAAQPQPDYSAPPPPRDTPRSYLDLPEDDNPPPVGGGLR